MSFALLDELSLSPATPAAPRLPADRAAQRGPGWFDSSWDLQRGCEVREGLPADPTLREWLHQAVLVARRRTDSPKLTTAMA